MAELIREAALEGARDELPHSLAAVIDDVTPRPDNDDLVDGHAILYVERDSQKGIVIGKRGAQLREVGTAARTQIEKLLGTRIYLDLRVKVPKNWQRDPKQLGRAWVLRAREVANGGHLVAVPGDSEAACGEGAIQDDRTVRRTFHPQVERCGRSRSRSGAPVDDLTRVPGLWRSRLTPLYTAVPKSSARAGKPATVPRTVMEAVQIEETATILRFVVMFASGDGLAVLLAASNATDWGFRDVRNRADRSVQDRPPGALASASPSIPGRPICRSPSI
jgi:hypothetical protein